jgi:hypothetical protein
MKLKFLLILFVLISNLSYSEVKKLYCRDTDNYSVNVLYDEKKQIIKFEKLPDRGKGLITDEFIIWEEPGSLLMIHRRTGKLRSINIFNGLETHQMSCSSNKDFKMF